MRSRAEIYREAARMIEARETPCKFQDCGYACCALSALTAMDDDNEEYRSVRGPFARRFRDAPWWNAANTDENRAARVKALREMATLCDTESSTAPQLHRQSGEVIIAILLILSVLCAIGSVLTHPAVRVAQVEEINQQEGAVQ